MWRPDILSLLKCPICSSFFSLSENGKSLLCGGERVHCYDIASAGYINLALKGGSGDSPESVASRKRFLDTGHYRPLADRISAIIGEYVSSDSPVIADMGCGTAYYSLITANTIKDSRIIGADLSKHAITYAAKDSKAAGISDRTFFTVASLFSVPMRDGVCDALTNVFSPCAEDEFCRLMKDDGILIVVGAGAEHLLELKSRLYEIPTLNEERKDLPANMTLISKQTLKYSFLPNKEERDLLFRMTPYFYHTSPADYEKLCESEPFPITASFDIYVYSK